MADETTQLLVSLEARIDAFEENMQKAAATASTSFSAIESRAQQSAGKLQDILSASMGKLPDVVSQVLGQVSNQMGSLNLGSVEDRLASFELTAQAASKAAAFGIGTVALAMQGFSIDEFLKSVTSANSELAQMAENAKTLNITTDQIQQLGYAMKTLGGLDLDKGSASALSFYEKIADEARNGSGEITKLFQANGMSLTDANGKLKDFNSLLDDASRLIANAGSEVDKIKIASILGLSKEWVQVLEQGPAALDKSKASAAAAGAVIDKDLVQKATEFDQWWGRSFNSLTEKAKAAAVEIASAFKNVFTTATDPATLKDMLDRLQDEQDKLDKSGGSKSDPLNLASIGNGWALNATASQLHDAQAAARAKIAADMATNRASGSGNQIGASQGAFGALVAPVSGTADAARDLTINKLPTNAPTTIPKSDSGGSDKLNELDRAEKAITKQTTALGAQAEALGKTQEEGAKAEAEFKLITAAQQAGVAVTGDVKTKIDQLSQSYADAKVKLEQMKLAQSESIELQTTFGESFEKLAEGGITNGITGLKQAFDGLLKSLVEMSLQAAILGKGPLAGIFGTSTIENGGVGGLTGALFGGTGGGLLGGLFGAHADGGQIHGPGTGTSDSIPSLLSDGEFVVNAKAAGNNRGLLEAINSGRAPRFSTGGPVGGSFVSTHSAASSTTHYSTGDIHITTQGSSGNPAMDRQNAEMMGRQVRTAVRAEMGSWAKDQMRNGGMLANNTRRP